MEGSASGNHLASMLQNDEADGQCNHQRQDMNLTIGCCSAIMGVSKMKDERRCV